MPIRVCYSLGGGCGGGISGTQNGKRICEGPCSPPKNSARRSGCRMAPGAPRRGSYSLGGERYFWTKYVHRTLNGARFCEGSRGARGESRTETRPKVTPEGRGVERLQGPRDRWATTLVGGSSRSSCTRLGMGRRFARGLGVPVGSRIQSSTQK